MLLLRYGPAGGGEKASEVIGFTDLIFECNSSTNLRILRTVPIVEQNKTKLQKNGKWVYKT